MPSGIERWIYALSILILGILFVILVVKLLFKKPVKKHPYKKRKRLMTEAERKFYLHLKQIIDDRKYEIFPQVPLSRLVDVSDEKKFWYHFNRISRKIVDYAVFKKPYYEPVLVIEYDDKSHEREDRKERDRFVNWVLKNADIPIIHVKYGRKLSRSQLQKYL